MESDVPSREKISSLADAAVALGAVEGYDDTPGGDLRAPYDATDACRDAVAAYRRAVRRRHSWVYGPERRYYYDRVD